MSGSYHQLLVSRDLGGAGVIALHVARHLRDQGRPSFVWIPGPGPAWSEAERLGLLIREYDPSLAFSRRWLPATIGNWRVAKQLRANGGGLVHVHTPSYYGALRRGLQVTTSWRVAHVHLEEEASLIRWAFKRPPELIVTCARFLVDQVRSCLPGPLQARQRIEAIPNAVDIERFSPADREMAKQRLDLPRNRPLLLMLANLAPHKGQETAVQVAAILKERGTQVLCWLAGVERGGDGDCTARLRTIIQELNVGDRVRLLGHRADTPDLLRAADFFLLPSTREGLPLSVLEAQATGVPVLAAPTAGIPEVVRDGETGFLIHADRPADYADRIESLIKHPELGQAVAERALNRVRTEHNWKAYCQRLVNCYDGLITQGMSTGRWRGLFG